jgi:dihydroorotate dehydrogenase (NAD+) catalytic subunit
MLKVNLGKLKLKNPVMVASGTFGYGDEFKDFVSLKKLGAIVSKTITLNPRSGNLPPRTCETPAGMLNSIGLENPGIEKFIKEKLPLLKKAGVPVIVSIASEKDPDEFIALIKRLEKSPVVSAFELNISCPNVKHSQVKGLIAQDPKATFEIVKMCRRATKKTLITKLSPNVTDIVAIAQAAKDAGSDALGLVNTLTGMCIDVEKQKPKLGMIIGGLSGPALRPIAVRMVWEVHKRINIPIIGMGGIIDAQSALEFILAGASCVSVGTANFVNPKASIEILDGIKQYLKNHKISDVNDLIGSV